MRPSPARLLLTESERISVAVPGAISPSFANSALENQALARRQLGAGDHRTDSAGS